MSIITEKILKDSSCIIGNIAYNKTSTNFTKKLRGIFKDNINTFFSKDGMYYHSKVINFAHYQRMVKEWER